MVCCFDVRSEKLKFIEAKCFFALDDVQLINYKGKLGLVDLEKDYDAGYLLGLRMQVLEDVEKGE